VRAPSILIVDDNLDTLKTFSKALIRRVRPASSSPQQPDLISPSLQINQACAVDEALEKLRTCEIDIVVVDLHLPGSHDDSMGGTEIITESIALDPLRPIIVVTGYGTVKLARTTFAQGIFDFIEKSESADDELVAAVQKAIDLRAEKIIRSGNPFTPMAGVAPRVFGGRTKELEFFEQRLYRALETDCCEHFVLLGNWGIGKSTLLKEYKKICRSRGHVACVVPLEPVQPGTHLSELARSIVEGVLRDCPYPLERFKRLTDYFQSFGLNILGTGLQFSRDVTKRDFLPQAFLHDTLINLWEDLKEKTGVLVILLDDLDNFQSVPEIVMTLRQTLSMEKVQKCRILIGMACSPNMWKRLITSDAHHPLARYFLARMELEPLSDAEMRDTILKCLGNSGVSFSPEIIDRVCTATQGHPFEMQILCSYLFDNQFSGRVDEEVWEKSLEAALRDVGGAIFDRWLDNISNDERKLLNLIATSGGTFTFEYIQVLATDQGILPGAGDALRVFEKLCANNLILRVNRSEYRLCDHLFAVYLQSASS
jgi:CheY-like chemotaxis protein